MWYSLLDLNPDHAVRGIYCIRHNASGKEYIGQSANIYKRLLEHIGNYKADTYIHKALVAHSPAEFCYTILMSISDLTINITEHEIRLIKERRSQTPFGYNLTKGGEGTLGYTHTDFTKEKLRNLKLGTTQSAETKLKIGSRQRG